jgi:hypothetical protein
MRVWSPGQRTGQGQLQRGKVSSGCRWGNRPSSEDWPSDSSGLFDDSRVDSEFRGGHVPLLGDEERAVDVAKRIIGSEEMQTQRLNHTFPALSLLIVIALLTFGCASSAGSVKTLVEPPVTETLGRYSRGIVASSSEGEAAKMTASDRDRIVALVLRKVQEQMPGRFADVSTMTEAADTLYVTINFTRYDEGSAFARMMLAGLGQIHINADVVGEDRVRQKVLMKSKVTKTFAWGGVYGGATGIRDVEEGFAEAVANVLLAHATKMSISSRRPDVSSVLGSPGATGTPSPTRGESRPPSTTKQVEGSSASGADSLPAPSPAPSDTPAAIGTRSTATPLASGPSGSPLTSAGGALEAKAAPSHPASGERHSWVLGSWEAVEAKSGVVEGLARFDFWHDGVQLKWRMLRAGWLSGVHTNQVASGTVSKISDSMIELNGKYEITNLVGVGQPVRHSLTRDGDRLRGYELTNDGMQLPWFLRRIR